ncbi:M48 family metallopeptidase [Magnetospirillum fulvum]|uniref:YgjP-like metallopeptidase domain-containing protein n=1 Tax=Magnetospirillum fulvum MGU-K5 TaxID=1316936 RepID=S9SAG2_MAGFU|nr:SprT family zinc-dependent metalloprotease [Magnetospirillum fulvum]EPY02902.1 hypothetical protein K678_03237 [Magnetospirillum fulvum MGU-K5]
MSPPNDPPLVIDIAGRPVTIQVRRSARAKRLSLRLDPAGAAVLVLPVGAPVREAERFARLQHDWLAARLVAAPPTLALVPGAVVPLLGVPHLIRHDPAAPRKVRAEAGDIRLGGPLDQVPRRVGAFLRAEAALLLAHRARTLAAQVGRPVGRVTVRDTKSRWGSCSAAGALSFSWRLVLAPDWVLTYVAAHEVAHLVEMNHGPAFWAVVERLNGDHRPARDWLKRHGPALHRIG